MDQMQGRAEAGAERGYLTASIDCRYHGRRCSPGYDRLDCYEHALVRSALSPLQIPSPHTQCKPLAYAPVWCASSLRDF